MIPTIDRCHVALLIGLFALSNCAPDPLREETVESYESGQKVRRAREFSLTREATGVVEKQFDGAWIPRSIAPGKGTVIRIHRSSFLIGSFDGSSHSEILIQLPDNPAQGRRYPLTAPSGSRVTRSDKHGNILGDLKVGEVAAYKFGNPVSGELKKVDSAWVEFQSVGAKTAVIRLRLKAELEPRFDFDVDEQFTVGITADPKTESGTEQ